MSDATQSPQMTLTISEAAARVKRTPRTIERWISDGDLEVIPSLTYETLIDEGALLTALHSKTINHRRK